MLALTLSLGVWQIQRLHWKRALLDAIDRGEASGPIPLTDHPVEFSRVVVQGVLQPSFARYGTELRLTPAGPTMGAHIISLLTRPGAAPLVVDRGWAPDTWSATTPHSPVTIEGYIRPSETGSWFTPADDPAARRTFSLNPANIGRMLGADTVAPFTLVALGPMTKFPEPAHMLPRPPNDHLSYAITWFSLSVVLAVVFALFVRQSTRKGRTP